MKKKKFQKVCHLFFFKKNLWKNKCMTRFEKYSFLGVDPQGECLVLTPGNSGSKGRIRSFFATRCGNCGSTKHRIKDCDKPWSACSYEHDGARGLPKHSLRCCPILHNYCRLCFLRGHDASAHEIRQFTQRELRQRFLLNQPRGLLTSILLLTTRPQGHEDLVMSHWRFGLMGQNFNRDNISRFYLRVPTGKHLGMDLGQRKPSQEMRAEMIRSKIEAAQFNSSLENPLFEAIPIPKFIMKLEEERILLRQGQRERFFEKCMKEIQNTDYKPHRGFLANQNTREVVLENTVTEVENCHYTLEYMRLKTRIENMYEEASRITFEIPNDLYEAPEDDLETEEVPEDMYSKAKNIRVQILYDVQAEQEDNPETEENQMCPTNSAEETGFTDDDARDKDDEVESLAKRSRLQ